MFLFVKWFIKDVGVYEMYNGFFIDKYTFIFIY